MDDVLTRGTAQVLRSLPVVGSHRPAGRQGVGSEHALGGHNANVRLSDLQGRMPYSAHESNILAAHYVAIYC